jgi:hypothetical protein
MRGPASILKSVVALIAALQLAAVCAHGAPALGNSVGGDPPLAGTHLRGLQAVTPLSSLQSCLSAAGITFVAPAASSFRTARQVWNLRVNASPALVSYPKSTIHVSKAVWCARQSGVKLVPRSGAHSYEGYAVQAGKLTLDLSNMHSVQLGARGIATIQAGARLGPIYLALWEQGKRTMPAGTCPTVGIGGHILGGGYGMLARRYGLASDRLVGIEMVDATGKVITANKTLNADLLWAHRGGGGGNFGIVTRFKVATVAVPAQVTVITAIWGFSAAVKAIQWYNAKFPALPDGISSDMFIGYGTVQMHALYLGSATAAQSVLATAGMQTIGTPIVASYKPMSYIDAVVQFGNQAQSLQPVQPSSLGLGSGTRVNPPSSFKVHSNFIKKPMSAAGASLAVNKIANATSQGIGGWMQLHAYGGMLNRIKAADSAFPHRSTLSSVQWYVSWGDARQAQSCTAWLKDLWTSMQPHVDSAAYINYIDKDLGSASTSAYYGSNAARLAAVKRKYDSGAFFSYPNSVQPAAAGT